MWLILLVISVAAGAGAKYAFDERQGGLAAICTFIVVICLMLVYYVAWIAPNQATA